MDDEKLLISHMTDLARRACREGCAASRFLTPAEAETVRRRFGRDADVTLAFDGGFEDAERSVAVFTQPDWGNFDRGDIIAGVSLTYRDEFALSHRDILGALMSLGLERDVFGDIVCQGSPAAFVCLREIAPFVIENFTRAGRVGVTAREVPLNALPQKLDRMELKTVTVASLRLDALVSAAFSVSRSEAAEAIEAGLVALSHLTVTSISKEVTEGAVMSFKGRGRARLLKIGGSSRKGRTFVEIGVYV